MRTSRPAQGRQHADPPKPVFSDPARSLLLYHATPKLGERFSFSGGEGRDEGERFTHRSCVTSRVACTGACA